MDPGGKANRKTAYIYPSVKTQRAVSVDDDLAVQLQGFRTETCCDPRLSRCSRCPYPLKESRDAIKQIRRNKPGRAKSSLYLNLLGLKGLPSVKITQHNWGER